MTFEELCAEAKDLPPRAANMASVMLPMVGPMSSVWHAALAQVLTHAARNGVSLTPIEMQEVIHAAIHPDERADWLLHCDDFFRAHRLVVNVHLAAEKWKLVVMAFLDEDDTQH
ncbi:hypothetical protein QTH90_15220 [Variovorax sp. J2P1-59]|uniref:hypothetical protein n=1 Tax=Variovorax flavidus TaxID=3053501 RepID=UPI002576185D|nr:hypothetical protein [Variovorax sp. J2P1-59]MDM0075752.1 hypothetical protein [Variovorax sp. J2P1-59]